MTENKPTGEDVLASLRCCVILPTYNNEQTIAHVVRTVSQYTRHILVVNDGSTDSTAAILEQFDSIMVVSYAPNQGKGWAMRQGFDKARAMGYEYAITMDTDGQHFAEDIVSFAKALPDNPNAIIIGSRNLNQNNVPGKSSFGNKFSNFWFKLETGIDMPDTQSGFRLYPLLPLRAIHFFTKKYEFEIEVLVRAAWNDVHIIHIPVGVYYPPKEERISHFRPFKDFSRISVLNTFLVLATFLYIKPRNLIRLFQKKKISTLFNDYILKPDETPLQKSMAVALGMFFGIAPFWGAQMLLVAFIAHFLKLNKAVALVVSNISIPPMIPFILFLSYKCGQLWFGDSAVHIAFDHHLDLSVIHRHFLQYVVGSFTLATAAALVSAVAMYGIVASIKKTKK